MLVGCLLMVLLWPFEKAAASHMVAHCRPAGADVGFAPDFPQLQDQEWGYRLGGWGGIAKGQPLQHRPVVFVHGNTRDASDWDELGKSVKQRFLDAGYSMQELWAISYNGKATKQLPSPSQCRTNAEVNISDLVAFVNAVAMYTGASRLDVIAHSLGVVLARKMMAEHPELSRLIEGFVAIAGPNHGTTVCRRAWLVWLIGWKDFMGCDEIAPGSVWLRSLNGARGEKEAPPPTKYLTIYDGTGTDRFYLPWLFSLPVRDQDSPALQGAENHTLPGLTHDDLRLDPHATSLYLKFVQGHSATSIHLAHSDRTWRPRRARSSLRLLEAY
jgi:triacylglycerol lipase